MLVFSLEPTVRRVTGGVSARSAARTTIFSYLLHDVGCFAHRWEASMLREHFTWHGW